MNLEWNRVTWYSKLLAIVVVLIAFAMGFYFGTRDTEIKDLFPKNEGIACTADAKVCSDGSTVGRMGPHCEFAACPGAKEPLGNDAGAIDIPTDFEPQ